MNFKLSKEQYFVRKMVKAFDKEKSLFAEIDEMHERNDQILDTTSKKPNTKVYVRCNGVLMTPEEYFRKKYNK